MTRVAKRAGQPFDLGRYLPYYLAHILHRYDGNMAADLQQHGLNNSAWRVLSMLDDRDGLTIKDLSRYTVLERSFVSRIVAALETKELVSRHVPAHDRRNVCVRLTPAGRHVLHDIMLPIVEDQMALAMQDVAAADRDQLLATLGTIFENVYRAARDVPPAILDPARPTTT